MVIIDIEKKIKEILFRRGYLLTWQETTPSSPEDMYEIKFWLDNGTLIPYRTMYIRATKYPRRKAFSLLLDDILNSYYESINIGKLENLNGTR